VIPFHVVDAELKTLITEIVLAKRVTTRQCAGFATGCSAVGGRLSAMTAVTGSVVTPNACRFDKGNSKGFDEDNLDQGRCTGRVRRDNRGPLITETFMDMQHDVFAEQTYGRAALRKLAPVPENFRLYSASWLGKRPEDWHEMEVTGAEFRIAKSGPNKGKLSILVPGTKRTVRVTKAEMRAAERQGKSVLGKVLRQRQVR
jgi:hypothetical protein